MTRALAAVDGSTMSVEVLRGAVVLADLLAAEAEGMYVGGTPSHDLRRLAASTGVRLTSREGPVEQVLSRALREPDVALGVLGTRGSGETTATLGRTAAALMSGADKPLLVVPPGSFPPERRHLHRALVPLDGRLESADSVEPMLRLLGSAGVDLVVVHVVDQLPVPCTRNERGRAASEWERDFLDRNLPFLHPRLRRCQGPPSGQVVQTAIDEQADIVVVGWSQDLAPGHARTLKGLLTGAARPVLLLPVTDGDVVDLTSMPQLADQAT